jgi:hypothetical protein
MPYTLYPGYLGNKSNVTLPEPKDPWQTIFEPFIGGGGALLPLMVAYPTAEVHCSDANPFVRYLFSHMISGDLQLYRDKLVTFVGELFDSASSWENLKLLYKSEWDAAFQGSSNNLVVGWLKSVGHSNVERCSGQGLNVAMSGEKIIGSKKWKILSRVLCGKKPTKRREIIEYNSAVSEILWRKMYQSHLIEKIDRWFVDRQKLSTLLAQRKGKVHLYDHYQRLPVVRPPAGRRLIISDAPYYAPMVEHYVDNDGKKRTRKVTPAYPGHLPAAWETWLMTEYFFQVAALYGNTDFVVWNYGSEPYKQRINQFIEAFPHAFICQDKVTSCVSVPSEYYRKPALGLETGVFFEID